MEGSLDWRVNGVDFDGTRFVVGYKSKSKEGFHYFNRLHRSPHDADAEASRLVNQSPRIAKRLKILKITPDIKKGAGTVMLLTYQPKYSSLERIFSDPGKARNVVSGTPIERYFSVSSFNEEVEKGYMWEYVKSIFLPLERFFRRK